MARFFLTTRPQEQTSGNYRSGRGSLLDLLLMESSTWSYGLSTNAFRRIRSMMMRERSARQQLPSQTASDAVGICAGTTHCIPGSKDNINFFMMGQKSGHARDAWPDVFVEIFLIHISLMSANGLSLTTGRAVLGRARIRDSHASVRENTPLQIFLQAASAMPRPPPESSPPT